MRVGSRRQSTGFTLIELMIVILIIGIMASLILVVSFDGIRRAEERATQTLIVKLETGMSDWVEAQLTSAITVNQAHNYLGGDYSADVKLQWLPSQRAQVIARIDRLKAEMPDVFFVQNAVPSAATDYPLNFAGRPYPGTPVLSATPQAHWNHVLPLGQALAWDPTNSSFGAYIPAAASPEYNFAGIGIYGASYVAAAGIYKNLGYLPQGYDGVDNNDNSFADEWAEGIIDPRTNAEPMVDDPDDPTTPVQLGDLIRRRLGRHTHTTARSEMLYALLVEGQGPAGTVFDREDFTPRDVRDTDGDGLPEFVDAWGQPLQFYRWPVSFHSGLQKGRDLYDGTETRDVNPLDPNQQLVAPAWWMNSSAFTTLTTDSTQISGKARFFQSLFFSLLDPLADLPPGAVQRTPPNVRLWDRGGFYNRRAYFSKFLIASSGPDMVMGIGRSGEDYNNNGNPDVLILPKPNQTYDVALTAIPEIEQYLILIENQAAPFNPRARLSLTGNANLYQPIPGAAASLQEASFDDITNQTLRTPGLGPP